MGTSFESKREPGSLSRDALSSSVGGKGAPHQWDGVGGHQGWEEGGLELGWGGGKLGEHQGHSGSGDACDTRQKRRNYHRNFHLSKEGFGQNTRKSTSSLLFTFLLNSKLV